MKIMLMVAAGVAVGLTAAMAVLIQVLERLLPIVLVAALVLIALRLARGWAERQAVTAHRTVPLDPSPTTDYAATYLRWGPPVCEDLDRVCT